MLSSLFMINFIPLSFLLLPSCSHSLHSSFVPIIQFSRYNKALAADCHSDGRFNNRNCSRRNRNNIGLFNLHGRLDDNDDDDDEQQRSRLESSFRKNSNQSGNNGGGNGGVYFGPGRGRSAPSQRKATGKSSSSAATVHVCTNCGAECVKWVGRCATCKEWNTVKEFKAPRVSKSGGGGGGSSSMGDYSLGRGRREGSGSRNKSSSSSSSNSNSWLDGMDDDNSYNGGGDYWTDEQRPIPITEILNGGNGVAAMEDQRIIVPDDAEFNSVLGGGIVPGSVVLIGGDPGVGKSTLLLQVAGKLASLAKAPRGIGMGMDDNVVDDNNKYGIQPGPVIYATGEETTAQVASRAVRLGVIDPSLLILRTSDADYLVDEVISMIHRSSPNLENGDFSTTTTGGQNNQKPSLVVVDSVQTMRCESGGSYHVGGVSQVRETVNLLLRLAKSTGVPVLLVGHVTKAGGVAGPRTIEHMVDAVLYLEDCGGVGIGEGGGGDNVATTPPGQQQSLSSTSSTPVQGGGGGGGPLRILRASKNRFGSTEEIGMYEQDTSSGALSPLNDPSSYLLSERQDAIDVPGSAVSVSTGGRRRAFTVEVQALVSPQEGNPRATGRRIVDGLPSSRLLLVLAVLSNKCGMSFRSHDVYVNVVGGMNLGGRGGKGGDEGKGAGGADLALAVSLASSLLDVPVRADTAFVGEVGLLGEVGIVGSIDGRISEARRMGFSRIIMPARRRRGKGRGGKGVSYRLNDSGGGGGGAHGIECIECSTVIEAIKAGLVGGLPKGKKRSGGVSSRYAFGGNENPRLRDNNRESRRTNVRSRKGFQYPSNIDEKEIIDDDEEDDDGEECEEEDNGANQGQYDSSEYDDDDGYDETDEGSEKPFSFQ